MRAPGQGGRHFLGKDVPEEPGTGVVLGGRSRRRAAPLAPDWLGIPGTGRERDGAGEAGISDGMAFTWDP